MSVNVAEVVPIGSSGKICLRHDSAISHECRSSGRLDWNEKFNSIPEIKSIHPSSIVIDVGAFIGDTAEPFLKRRCYVTAFEPQPDAFRCLVHNCPGATCHNKALGDGGRFGLLNTGGNMGGRWLVPGDTIETVPLDTFAFLRLDFLKIDVEGHEVHVLKGAMNTIQRFRPMIHIEINPNGLAFFGCKQEDIFNLLPGYHWREVSRYGNQHWDLLGKSA